MLDLGQYHALSDALIRNNNAQQNMMQNQQLVTPPNTTGGKGVIKYSPSTTDLAAGLRQQNTLLVWESPDGQPHFVTTEVGRIVGSGIGGAGASWPLATDPSSGLKLSYRANAEITIGTPGTMQDPFRIDINRGQRFTTLASYIAVTALMASPPFDPTSDGSVLLPGFTSGSLAVYATTGVGYAASVAPCVFTQYIDAPAPGAIGALQNIKLVVPPRANFLLMVLSSNASDVVQLQFLDNANDVICSTQAFNNGTLVQPIPISEDCYKINMISTGGTQANYRFVYQLSV